MRNWTAVATAHFRVWRPLMERSLTFRWIWGHGQHRCFVLDMYRINCPGKKLMVGLQGCLEDQKPTGWETCGRDRCRCCRLLLLMRMRMRMMIMFSFGSDINEGSKKAFHTFWYLMFALIRLHNQWDSSIEGLFRRWLSSHISKVLVCQSSSKDHLRFKTNRT